MKKELREKVWIKYNKHCAYCGCPISYKEMQVDHKLAKARGGTDDFDNLMPSCRLDNYHKDTYTIEEYREQLILKIDRIMKDSNTRLLNRHRIIKFNCDKIVFYFEKQGT